MPLEKRQVQPLLCVFYMSVPVCGAGAMCVGVHVHACASVCMCVKRPEDNLQCHASEANHLAF